MDRGIYFLVCSSLIEAIEGKDFYELKYEFEVVAELMLCVRQKIAH